MLLGEALEAYTRKRPNEVLLLRVCANGSEEEVLVFRGASSYLTRATPSDPGEPIPPVESELLSLDRQRAPYSPINPNIIAANLDLDAVRELLLEVGLAL
ncbi:MAG: hypothetical protein H7Y22_08275 [Gemmatimonadaceae bacterium]|nr:hypothetical protein [Gloeobacterales cyanobacterium ES-bin-141]